jgi:hypothetical protein
MCNSEIETTFHALNADMNIGNHRPTMFGSDSMILALLLMGLHGKLQHV